MRKYLFNLGYFFFIIQSITSICFSQPLNSSPIPEDSRQMILVLTDSPLATKGYLFRFERKNQNSSWELVKEKIPIVLGRNGLAWGRGLNQVDTSKLSVKVEGDGKSPAGIFKLSAAFGYASSDEMKGLKFPYIHITEMLECIDDVKSEYYNQLVKRNEVENIDWQSSEKMFYADIWYKQGVVVQNNEPAVKGGGSCIFLHNWSVPDETSAGCTELEPLQLSEIIYWLDSSANPILIQLTKELYDYYLQSWKLPKNLSIIY